MTYKRLIARLDFKDKSVIKGIQLEGLRVVGEVSKMTEDYYSQGIDELLLIDAVASLYGKLSLVELIREVTKNCFVPITVGGGVDSLDTAEALFRAGADKVAINTAAMKNPNLITDIASKYGSQAVVVHIEAKSNLDKNWECFTEYGREPSGVAVGDWIKKSQEAGAGEYLLTSIDRDGTKQGPDLDLIDLARKSTNLPLVASGGFRTALQMKQALFEKSCQGVAIGSLFHYKLSTVPKIRRDCQELGVDLRN